VSLLSPSVLHHPLCDVVVETDSEVVQAELRERLEPYVRVSSHPIPAGPDHQPALAVVARTEESVPLPQEPSRKIMIRDHPQFERYRRPADLWTRPNEFVMFERKNSSVFRWSTREPARVVVTNGDAASLAKSVRRLIQDFLRLRVWHLGGIIVEVGKTTLLARFLGAGAGMVSNDEVALCPTADGIVAYGLPMLVNVRPPLVERFPQLRELSHFMEGSDRKAPVRYDAFARLLGGSVTSSTERLVGVLLRPHLEPADDVDATMLAAALMDNILSGPGFVGLGWTSPWRYLPPGFPEPRRAEVERRAAHIADHVPAVTIGRLHTPGDIADAARKRLESRMAS
jgi:hypothetical protein